VPELPEVETVRVGLEAAAVGRRISSVEVFGPRTVRRHVGGPRDFVARLTGRRIEGVYRRGKYLWLALSATEGERGWGPATSDEVAECLVAHLGMSGQFLSGTSGEADPAHLRARFVFDDGERELRFADQRTFGGLLLDETVAAGAGTVPASIAHIALDPIDPLFDRGGFTAALRRRRTGIKRALLDQSLVSGIGNIYADEALWRSRLHYARGSDTLRRADVERLLDDVVAVLMAALRAGGTSFDALYVAVNGESGWFDRSLEVYGREGEPCSRCGAAIRREPFMNRSSYRCPRCQRTPGGNAARW
jgi:formamidopyrimidine-DNA glycosylase